MPTSVYLFIYNHLPVVAWAGEPAQLPRLVRREQPARHARHPRRPPLRPHVQPRQRNRLRAGVSFTSIARVQHVQQVLTKTT